MKIYAVTKGTDLYKRNGGEYDLLYAIPEDFQYRIFVNIDDATFIYNIINLKIQRTKNYLFAENKRLIEFDNQYSIEEVLEEGKYNTIKDEDSLGEISKHIPRID